MLHLPHKSSFRQAIRAVSYNARMKKAVSFHPILFKFNALTLIIVIQNHKIFLLHSYYCHVKSWFCLQTGWYKRTVFIKAHSLYHSLHNCQVLVGVFSIKSCFNSCWSFVGKILFYRNDEICHRPLFWYQCTIDFVQITHVLVVLSTITCFSNLNLTHKNDLVTIICTVKMYCLLTTYQYHILSHNISSVPVVVLFITTFRMILCRTTRFCNDPYLISHVIYFSV